MIDARTSDSVKTANRTTGADQGQELRDAPTATQHCEAHTRCMRGIQAQGSTQRGRAICQHIQQRLAVGLAQAARALKRGSQPAVAAAAAAEWQHNMLVRPIPSASPWRALAT